MDRLLLATLDEYIDINLGNLYRHQEELLQEISLDTLLQRNPYLLTMKNVAVASLLVENWLDEFLSSSEEKLFGDFLEKLAIFVAGKTCNGQKSSATGVDLEFVNNGVEYVISIKSGSNWGNSSQHNKLEQDLRKAVATKKQGRPTANVQSVLGICYGKTKTSYVRGYRKVVGQSFWYLISENKNLYTDIIEPIGFRAKEHNEKFLLDKAGVSNKATGEFIRRFCDDTGAINWNKLVEWNSGNFDPTDW